jgi:hypothetical protein
MAGKRKQGPSQADALRAINVPSTHTANHRTEMVVGRATGMGPIRTKYNGIEYRSRHEAKYAAFWDWLGWNFIYEPLDGDGYIPDFLIDGEKPLLIEVKAAQTREEYEAEVPKIVAGLERHWAWDSSSSVTAR